MKYKDIKTEYRLLNTGDAWGRCAGFAFALCDVLTERGECPDYWEFRQSPMGSDTEVYEYEVLKDVETKELLLFSDILYRLYNMLKTLGKDY